MTPQQKENEEIKGQLIMLLNTEIKALEEAEGPDCEIIFEVEGIIKSEPE